MKYQVIYLKKKKDNKYARQVAGDFLTVEDACWYEKQIKGDNNIKNVEVVPIL